MNRRWLDGYLPDPADVRRRLGLVASETDVRGGEEREAGNWRARWRYWLGRALRDPALWCPNRRSVTGGVAVGLFVSWIPVPLQMLLAAVLASALRVHVPVSVVMVWFTNPLTIAPLLYAAWRTGSTLLGEPAQEANAEATVELSSEAGVDTLLANLADIWPALLAGCLFWAVATAVAGFVTTRVLWRVVAVSRWRRRPARRAPDHPAPAAGPPRRPPRS